jgi:hypothetical protein
MRVMKTHSASALHQGLDNDCGKMFGMLRQQLFKRCRACLIDR